MFLSAEEPTGHEVQLRSLLTPESWANLTHELFPVLSNGGDGVTSQTFQRVLPANLQALLLRVLSARPLWGSPDAAARIRLSLPVLSASVFAQLDTDGDGALSSAEFASAREAVASDPLGVLFHAMNGGAHPTVLAPVHCKPAIKELYGAPSPPFHCHLKCG